MDNKHIDAFESASKRLVYILIALAFLMGVVIGTLCTGLISDECYGILKKEYACGNEGCKPAVIDGDGQVVNGKVQYQ